MWGRRGWRTHNRSRWVSEGFSASLLPVFSKILPDKNNNRDKKKLIPEHQFEFRNKHSTIEQMHRLINEVIIALENKEYCTALFMDIEKAYYKINHESLLQTIRKQFPEQVHKLIKSYLSSRTFVIKIKDTYSEVKDIKAGVPQGSVLGPLLYTTIHGEHTNNYQ